MTGRMLTRMALAVAAVLVAAACGSGSGEGGSGGGGTLVIDASFDLKTVDPGREYELTGQMLTKAMYETLLTFEGNDVTTPVAGLATGYELSPDATTVT
ncbi:MAG: ABC transporter substrate-binding protein, partial [Actinomycetes bacterium]